MPEAHPDSKTTVQLKNVLAVDNDPIMLKFLSRILEKAGLHVVTAKDGITAIDTLESYTPDLFFIDLVMPNIDGRALCRIIRSKELFKTSPTRPYQQVGQTYDNIIAQAADAILGKLHFYVIISSTTNPKLKWPPLRIDERSLRLLTTAAKR